MPLPVATLKAPEARVRSAALCEPIVFDGCFGWYHPGSADLGVVLCGPHGYEELCVHRHWRELGRDLSAHAVPTLRFDYPGTGDSTGDDETPSRVQAWLQSIHSAIATLRRLSGVDRVALVGLRIGAILAAAAAEQQGDLAALVLLAPPGSGRACIRELRALEMMHAPARHSTVTADSEPRGLEAAGFVYTSETLADLAALSLLRSGAAPARNILLLHRPNTVPDKAFQERLLRCGAAVDETVFQDYQVLIRDADSSAYPAEGFGHVVNWLTGLTGRSANPAPAPIGPAVLRLTGADERPVFYGRRPDLFGIMSEPHGSSHQPAVVFLNTGLNHRIGTSRMTVTMSRRLAGLGFASLRLDIGGIGDSDAAPGRSANDPNDSAAVADVSRALAWLESRGFEKVILIGLCSGAKLALETTLQDDRVAGQVLVNLGGFWKPADATAEFGSRRKYLRLARQGSTWRRLLRGEIDVRGIAKAFAVRYAESVDHMVTESLRKLLRKGSTRGTALKLFQGLVERGVKTAFIYVEEDPGLDEMEVIFGRGAPMLAAVPNVSVCVTKESDHIFSRDQYRRHLFSLVEQTLAAMVPAANANPGLRATPCNSVTPVES